MRYSPDEFQAKLKRWVAEQPQDVERGLKRAALDIIAHTQSRRLRGPKMPRGVSGGFAGSRLAVGVGRLWRSLTHQVRIDGSRITAKVGTNVKYARIHEFGGRIRAKKGGWLHFKVGGQWVKVKEVVIPERPFLRPSVVEKFQATLKHVKDAVMEGYRRGA